MMGLKKLFPARWIAVVIGIVLLASTATMGEEAKPETNEQATPTAAPVQDKDQITVESIEAKRTELASQLDVARKNASGVTENTPADIVDAQNQIVQLYERLDTLFSQQIGAIKQRESQLNTKQQLNDQLNQLKTNGPAEEPPYSYLLLDNLRGQIQVEKEKVVSLESGLKAAQSTLDGANAQSQEKTNARILAKETLDKNQDGAAIPLLTMKLRIAQLESQIANETVNLRKLELENQKEVKNTNEIQSAIVQERIKWIEKETAFLEKDLNDLLSGLDLEKKELMKDLKTCEDDLSTATKKWESAQDRLARDTEQSPQSIEEEITKRFERLYNEEKVNRLNDRIIRVQERKDIWRHRYDTVNRQASMKDLNSWLKSGNSRITELESIKTFLKTTLSGYRRDKDTSLEKEERYKDDKTVLLKISKQKEFVQKRLDLTLEEISRIEALQRLYAKLIDEIKQETQTWSFRDTLQYAGLLLERVSNYTLWSNQQLDDDQEAILTVGKIVIAIVYLVVGIIIIRLFCRYVIKAFLQRLGMDAGAILALSSLTFYCLLFFVLLTTLRSISIPLTVFAFLGGALAIGIGFGSQNLLANFISGILLLIERPIRPGDLIEVDGVVGVVQTIGPRCTRLLTFSNVDHLIPNSKLLENKVINITFKDKIVRTIVSVGVEYGCDLREVFRLMKKAVVEHGLIEKYPEPYVTLTEFGDNAVLFDVRFWIDMKDNVNRLIVESDVRHRIYNLFRDSGIVIAFPQRDLHLDTSSPLEIKMVPPGENS